MNLPNPKNDPSDITCDDPNQLATILGHGSFIWLQCATCLSEIDLMLEERIGNGLMSFNLIPNKTERMLKNYFDLFMRYIFDLSQSDKFQPSRYNRIGLVSTNYQ